MAVTWRCQQCREPLHFEGVDPGCGPGAPQTPRLDDSFVLLPERPTGGAAAAAAAPGGAGAGVVSAGSPSSSSGASYEQAQASAALALARLLDAADGAVPGPVCRECAAALHARLARDAEDAARDVAAYEALLSELGASLPDARRSAAAATAFASEARALERAALHQEALLAADLESLRLAEAALATAQAAERELDEREAAAAREADALAAAAFQQEEEAASVAARTAAASRHLDRLRRTHVFNEAFHIWHDGPFGTICGFRLGRTSSVLVEWEEINAAYGCAVLLLATMANVGRVTFASHVLLPMGSTPRVRDCERGGTYDLFGPVSPINVLATQRFDRAQQGFLACLSEFASFAAARDASAGCARPFELPYPIEPPDRVDGRSVRLTLSRDDKWTAAMKLVLTNLKVALAWLASAQPDAGAAAPPGA